MKLAKFVKRSLLQANFLISISSLSIGILTTIAVSVNIFFTTVISILSLNLPETGDIKDKLLSLSIGICFLFIGEMTARIRLYFKRKTIK